MDICKCLNACCEKGKVGTSVLMWPATPNTTKSEDVMAAEIFNQVFSGQLLHPLVFGDYPPVLRYLVDKRDTERGDGKVSLPPFTEEEKKMLSEGVTDFIALNLYSGVKASYNGSATSQSQSILLGPVMADMPFVQVTNVNDFSV
ncbi:Beta-glucosidase 31, partial [Frankliniella fusca]